MNWLNHQTTARHGDQTAIRVPRSGADALLTLLLGHTDGLAVATSRLGVLAAHAHAPRVAETAVKAHLVQADKVVAELSLQVVGDRL
jgi:hypothetical protein